MNPIVLQMRAAKPICWIIVGGIWGGLFAFLLIVVLLKHGFDKTSSWTTLGLVLAVGLLWWIWLKRFEIDVDAEAIYYRTLFGGRRIIRFDELGQYKIEVGIEKYTDRFRPPYRLVLISKNRNVRRVDINMKVFRADDIQALIQRLKDVLAMEQKKGIEFSNIRNTGQIK